MRRTGWLVAVLAIAAACAERRPVISSAPSVAVAARGADVRMVWRTRGLHPIGQPQAIGGMAVAVVADGSAAWLVGIDPATGVKRWQQPITPSAAYPWDPLGFVTAGEDQVAYLRPTRPDSLYGYAELVVADARTGGDVMRSPDALFASRPMRCGQGAAICAFTADWGADRRDQIQLELATGRFAVINHDIPLRAEVMADFDAELIDLGDGPDNSIGLLRDGRLQWFRRVSDLMPRWKFSSRTGAMWRHHDDAHVIAGSILGGVWRNGTWVRDLALDATLGIAEDTGEVRWRAPGTFVGCIADPRYAVRCRARGIVRARRGAPFSYDGLQITVEGYDPATGLPTWSVALGAAETLALDGHAPPYAGPTRRVIAAGADLTVLDYATGATEPVAPGATFWCAARAHYTFPIRFSRGLHWGQDVRPGGMLGFPCDGHGRPASALPDAVATFGFGAELGDRAVIATRDGFLGFARGASSATAATSGR